MEQAVGRRGGKRSLDFMFWSLLAAGLALFALVTVTPGARRGMALADDLARANAVKARLAVTAQVLEARERALATDPFYTEAVLREKMKYTRSGEKEVQMPRRSSLLTLPVAKLYVPRKGSQPSIAENLACWLLLAASGALVLTAFVFFDRPGKGR